jgi:hypothetical protein
VALENFKLRRTGPFLKRFRLRKNSQLHNANGACAAGNTVRNVEIRREKATHTAFSEIVFVQECSFILRVTPIVSIREIVTDEQAPEMCLFCDTSFFPVPEIKLGQLISDPKTPAQRLGDGRLEPGPLDVVLPSYLEARRTIRMVQNTHFGVGLSAKVLGL